MATVNLPGLMEKFSAPVQELYNRYADEVADFVKSIDYHDFIDLYNEESFVPTIIKKYEILIKELQAKLFLKDGEIAGLCYIIAYQAAQEQEKSKKKTKVDLLSIALSFPWCVPQMLWNTK
jgi:hypothetical protein